MSLRGGATGGLAGAGAPMALMSGSAGSAGESAAATVLEVFGRDRPGLLYAITRALHEAGVVIHLAKVNTEGRRVADVFYVTERDGAKLDEARCAAVREVILGALG